MARTYKRDQNGRFSSGGGGGAKPKAAAKKGPMFDPKVVARQKRANANSLQAQRHEADGVGSKMSRKLATANRALKIYSGKVDPKVKTKARLTRKRK
jgi:hypothetical protein